MGIISGFISDITCLLIGICFSMAQAAELGYNDTCIGIGVGAGIGIGTGTGTWVLMQG